MQDRYRDLENKFNTLQEFDAANRRVTPPSQVEMPPTSTTPPHNDSPSASQDDSLPVSLDEGFQPVRNGAKSTRSTKQLLPPTTFNRL